MNCSGGKIRHSELKLNTQAWWKVITIWIVQLMALEPCRSNQCGLRKLKAILWYLVFEIEPFSIYLVKSRRISSDLQA